MPNFDAAMESLSWVCPKCKREGDLRVLLELRDGQPICDDPECRMPVETTNYVRRDAAGIIRLSMDWVYSHGHPYVGYAYVVRGTTGGYADRVSWSVVAYTSWERAKVHALSAELRAYEICLEHAELLAHGRYDVVEGKNEFDRNMKVGYTGASYYVDAVPFKEV